METRTWSLLKSLLADALERPRNERGTFIARAWGNSGLYDQARALREQADDDDFLGAPFEASLTEASDEGRRQDLLGRRVSALRIERLLGTGGMGDVYAARDQELNRTVALKFVSARSIGTAGVERFIREAQSASALNHPCIVTVHEVIRFESTLAIVMEIGRAHV